MSREDREAKLQELQAQDEQRVEHLLELDRREMQRVVKESQVDVLGRASARWNELTDKGSLNKQALDEAAFRLQFGWSGTLEERMQQAHPYHWDGYEYRFPYVGSAAERITSGASWM